MKLQNAALDNWPFGCEKLVGVKDWGIPSTLSIVYSPEGGEDNSCNLPRLFMCVK